MADTFRTWQELNTKLDSIVVPTGAELADDLQSRLDKALTKLDEMDLKGRTDALGADLMKRIVLYRAQLKRAELIKYKNNVAVPHLKQELEKQGIYIDLNWLRQLAEAETEDGVPKLPPKGELDTGITKLYRDVDHTAVQFAVQDLNREIDNLADVANACRNVLKPKEDAEWDAWRASKQKGAHVG